MTYGMKGLKGIPAFRYGSLLYTPYKELPYHYRFYGLIMVFLTKIHFSEWLFPKKLAYFCDFPLLARFSEKRPH